MNKDFKSLDQKFMPLTEAELVEVEGGWVGGDLVRAVFDMVASEVDLVQDLVVLAMVAVLTTVVLQAQTFLTNIFCFDIKPLVRLDLDKRLFSVKVTLGLFFK